MADLYKNTGLPLYSPATHLLRFCSMPGSYKRSITTKKEEAKVYSRKGFITPSVPFAERWFIRMNVDFYEYDGLGYVVDPESDTKVVTVILIGKQTVKANPRPAVIYVTGGKIDESYEKLEELKKYCADNKVVFICPKATDAEELGKTY